MQNRLLKGETVAVFGGTGFIGSVTVRKLVEAGAIVRLASRDPNKVVLPQSIVDTHQVLPLPVDLNDFQSILSICDGAKYVVNLVGVFLERGFTTFKKIHVDGAHAIADAARQSGAKRVVHISAMGASSDSLTKYLSTKAQAEKSLKDFNNVTILRPCAVFGEDDKFTNNFVDMVSQAPFFFLFGGGVTRFQIVYVGDVADAIIAALIDPTAAGKIYELGGAKVYTIKELIEIISQKINRKRPFVSAPLWVVKVFAFFLEMLKKPPLTRTIVSLTQRDAVVSPGALTIQDLGITPKSFEDILPRYRQVKK